MTDLAEIKARCEAATPGPWDYDEMHQEITTPYSSDQYWLIVSEARQTPDQDYPVDQFGHTYDANFAFIAHAREDIPALLAEVERLMEDVDALHRECARLYEIEDEHRKCPL